MDYFVRKLDDKRRLTMPVELRTEFSSGLVITRGFGDYLHLYPQSVWAHAVEPALEGSILDERIADLNVRFRRGKFEASWMKNRVGSRLTSIYSIMLASIKRLLRFVQAPTGV